ncbi:uncharacterized protein LOC129751552 [Uranotaenia lowii]|uniref:uncharacterized protein LOC129751552 n=1 Tax=Uranotaenia lowii TaxID=190385 RepID=UPI0024793B65|nr:uncharacterized protein LOC129751552 [Uranotaenia lowii]
MKFAIILVSTFLLANAQKQIVIPLKIDANKDGTVTYGAGSASIVASKDFISSFLRLVDLIQLTSKMMPPGTSQMVPIPLTINDDGSYKIEISGIPFTIDPNFLGGLGKKFFHELSPLLGVKKVGGKKKKTKKEL